MTNKISVLKRKQILFYFLDYLKVKKQHYFRNSKTWILFILTISLSVTNVNSQNFPQIPEEIRLQKLQPPQGKLKVVIDTDTYNEIDDQFAVVYALLSPEQMEVEAIYAAPYFNNRSEGPADGMEKSHQEILRLLEKLDRPHEDFVFRGSEGFLQNNNQPYESDAAKDLVKRAMASEEPLYVLTLGAPTNIASAILMEPEIINKIVVVWLGGKGLNWHTAKEFNLQQDVLSSRYFLIPGYHLFNCPLSQLPHICSLPFRK